MANIGLLISQPFQCDYLPDRIARYAYVDIPPQFLDNAHYSLLINHGFRRSGQYLYKPACQSCAQCQSVRISVDQFIPSRNQSRAWKKNQTLTISTTEAAFDQEQYDLFLRYQNARHTGGSMADLTPEKYLDFLTSSWAETVFYCFRKEKKLVAVAVTDHLKQGLSAVYTFFEPTLAKQSLGDFAIQWQINKAKKLALPWVYLGYWISDCQKMSYKSRYEPSEYFVNGDWQPSEKSVD